MFNEKLPIGSHLRGLTTVNCATGPSAIRKNELLQYARYTALDVEIERDRCGDKLS